MAMIFINAICKCSRMEIMHIDLWHREIISKLFFGILLVILCIFYFLFQEYRTCSSDAVDKEFASGLAVHFGQFQHAYN